MCVDEAHTPPVGYGTWQGRGGGLALRPFAATMSTDCVANRVYKSFDLCTRQFQLNFNAFQRSVFVVVLSRPTAS